MDPDERVCVKFQTELRNQIFQHDVDHHMFSYVAALHVFAKHFNGKPITSQIRNTWNDLMRELKEDTQVLYDLSVNGAWSAEPLKCLLDGNELDVIKLTECLRKETPLTLLIRYNALQERSMFCALENLISASLQIEKLKKSHIFQEMLQTHVAFLGEDKANDTVLNRFREFDIKVTMELICKLEKSGEREKVLKLCNCVLFCMWRTGSLYSIIEMTTKWCQLNFAKQGTVGEFVAFLQRSMKGKQKPCTVTHCLILMQVVWEMVKDPAFGVCVEILVYALNLLKKEDDPGNQCKIKILQTISQLLPLSKIARLCLLAVFLLNPCTNTYFAVEEVFASPVKKAELQMDLQTAIVISIDSQLLYQTESLDWSSIKDECMSMLLPDDLTYIESKTAKKSGSFSTPDWAQMELCAACQTIGKDKNEKVNAIAQVGLPKQDDAKKGKHGWPCPVSTCKLVSGRMWYLNQHLKLKHEWKKDEIDTFIRSHGVKKTAVWIRKSKMREQETRRYSSVNEQGQDSSILQQKRDASLISSIEYSSTLACKLSDKKVTSQASSLVKTVPQVMNEKKITDNEQEGNLLKQCGAREKSNEDAYSAENDENLSQNNNLSHKSLSPENLPSDCGKDVTRVSESEKCSTSSLKLQDPNESDDHIINCSHSSGFTLKTFNDTELHDLNDSESNLLCNERMPNCDSNQESIDESIMDPSSTNDETIKDLYHEISASRLSALENGPNGNDPLQILALYRPSNDLISRTETENQNNIFPSPEDGTIPAQSHSIMASPNLEYEKQMISELKAQQSELYISKPLSQHEGYVTNISKMNKSSHSRGWYKSVDLYIQACYKNETQTVETSLRKSIDESVMFLFKKKIPQTFDSQALLSYLHSAWKGFPEIEDQLTDGSENIMNSMKEERTGHGDKQEIAIHTPTQQDIIKISKAKQGSIISEGITILGDKIGINMFPSGILPSTKMDTHKKTRKMKISKTPLLNQAVQTFSPGDLYSGEYHEIVCKFHSKVKRSGSDKPKSNPSPTIFMGIGFRKIPQRTIATQTVNFSCLDQSTDGKKGKVINEAEDFNNEKMKKDSILNTSRFKSPAKKRICHEQGSINMPDQAEGKRNKSISFEEALMDPNLKMKPHIKMNLEHSTAKVSLEYDVRHQETKSKAKYDTLSGLSLEPKEVLGKKKQKRSFEEMSLKNQEWKSPCKRKLQGEDLQRKGKEQLLAVQKSVECSTQNKHSLTLYADKDFKSDITSKSLDTSPECTDASPSELRQNVMKNKLTGVQDYKGNAKSEMTSIKKQNAVTAGKDKSSPGVSDLHDYKKLLEHAHEQQLKNITADDKMKTEKNDIGGEFAETGMKTCTDLSVMEASKIKPKSKRCIKLRSLSNATPSIEKRCKENTEMGPEDDFTSDANTLSLEEDDTTTLSEYSCSLCGRKMTSAFALACHKRKKHKSKAKMFIPDESVVEDNETEEKTNAKRKQKNAIPVHTVWQTENVSCAQGNVPLRNKIVSSYPTTDRICDKLILTLYSSSIRNMVEENRQKIMNEDFYELFSVLFTHSPEKYDCLFCNKVLINRRSFRRHTLLYHDVDLSELVAALVLLANTKKLKQCSICQIDFGKFQALEKHFLSSHCDKQENPLNCKTRLPRLLCHVCHKISFFNLLSLTRHLNINHNLTILQLKKSGHFDAMLRKAVSLGLPIQVPAWLDVVKEQDTADQECPGDLESTGLELKQVKGIIDDSSSPHASDGENDLVESQAMDCNSSENAWSIPSNELIINSQDNTSPPHARMRRNAYTQAARKITLETLENHRQRKWAEFQYSKTSLKKVASSLSSNTPMDSAKVQWNHFKGQCWLCKHFFSNRVEYATHLMHHIRSIDKCDYRCLFPGCLYGFKNEEDLLLHEQLHNGGMHVCLICGDASVSACDLVNHEWWYHSFAVSDLAKFRLKFCINQFWNKQ